MSLPKLSYSMLLPCYSCKSCLAAISYRIQFTHYLLTFIAAAMYIHYTLPDVFHPKKTNSFPLLPLCNLPGTKIMQLSSPPYLRFISSCYVCPLHYQKCFKRKENTSLLPFFNFSQRLHVRPGSYVLHLHCYSCIGCLPGSI
jgi:hypothetical protein